MIEHTRSTHTSILPLTRQSIYKMDPNQSLILKVSLPRRQMGEGGIIFKKEKEHASKSTDFSL